MAASTQYSTNWCDEILRTGNMKDILYQIDVLNELFFILQWNIANQSIHILPNNLDPVTKTEIGNTLCGCAQLTMHLHSVIFTMRQVEDFITECKMANQRRFIHKHFAKQITYMLNCIIGVFGAFILHIPIILKDIRSHTGKEQILIASLTRFVTVYNLIQDNDLILTDIAQSILPVFNIMIELDYCPFALFHEDHFCHKVGKNKFCDGCIRVEYIMNQHNCILQNPNSSISMRNSVSKILLATCKMVGCIKKT
jgi:hypothetical protein